MNQDNLDHASDELHCQNPITERSYNPGIVSKVGSATIRFVDSLMTPPITEEPSENGKKVIGAGVIAFSAMTAGSISLVALDRATGMGVNPLNYVVPLHFLSNR